MDIKKLKHIHFVGIVGVGMTALALCAQDLGIKVTGSDAPEAFETDDILKRRGISWKVGFSKKNLDPRPDFVVTTGAHGGFDNPEVLAAKKLGIPVMSHAEALANFAEGKETIAVCGVGGKTTTCAMIATILDRVGMHPSFAIGVGNIPSLGTPGRYDKKGNVFICEADEFAVSPGVDNRPRFTLLNPEVVVVTNIEHDHPDIYPTLEDTKKVFGEFFRKLEPDGLLIINDDNQNTIDICEEQKSNAPLTGYGFTSTGPSWKISDLKFEQQQTKFHISLDGLQDHDITLSVPGKFNVYNAAAAFLASREVCMGIDDQLVAALKEYTGCKRRFEKVAEVHDILVFDDYAHHPTEINAIIEATKEWFPGRRIVAVFQPHTYTRTKALFSEFAKSFSGADKIGFMDIYAAAREKIDPDVSSKKLTEEAVKHGVNATYTEGPEGTVDWLIKTSKPGDVVLILGAGDIFLIIKDFVSKLKQKYSTAAGQVDKFEEFKKQFPDAQENISLASLTTLNIGGPVKLVLVPKDEETLIHAIKFSRGQRIAFLVIGSGSDLLVNDNGFEGLVLKNEIRGIKILGSRISVKGGSLLQELVDTANEHGLAGFEKLAGVPGTVAGAVYGNAGAYGQTINDHLSRVRVSDCEKEFWIRKEECDFGYRDSMFKKKKNLVILEVEFEAENGNSEELQRVSQETIALRLQKYKEGIKTPGSFFKNVVAENLSPEVLSKIPTDKIKYGKIPAGYLLEEVGAKGMRRGDVQIAPHHGNLFMNVDNATAEDFFSLAKEFKSKVQEKFGITLEPEVQLVGFKEEL
ncbi:MAG: UDP-N-acetylmuramate--L-alanine ligase [bacterium]|nr:UDP-N-acetylmuramate--L-alanine ligase [bacterium]